MSRARARAIEYARVQSEIRRNDAETKKLEIEANCFKKSNGILSQYILPGLVGGILIVVCFIDTFKNIYDMTSHQIEDREKIQKIISDENDLLKKERIEFEKHYLEKLMRIASANAFQAYAGLARRNYIYLDKTSKYHSEEKAATTYSQACYLLHDYWQIVIEIATETQEGLLPEVKEKVASWLKEGEEKNICPEECRTGNEPLLLSPFRRKSLDLIERHVTQIRAGNSQFPDDLIRTFIDQPEFQEPGNEENSK